MNWKRKTRNVEIPLTFYPERLQTKIQNTPTSSSCSAHLKLKLLLKQTASHANTINEDMGYIIVQADAKATDVITALSNDIDNSDIIGIVVKDQKKKKRKP